MIPQPPGLADLTIANARQWLTGASLETLANNDGPAIRDWLARRGIHAPAAWCAAFACAMAEDAARALGLTLQLHRSAGALRLLDLNPELVLTAPETGCLVVEDHGHGLGHVSICTSVVLVDGEVSGIECIAGNTSQDGRSRNGDRVAERPHIFPDQRIAGFIRVC